MVSNAILLFCAASFLGYGLSCLVSAHMVDEFRRYRLSGFRKMTGVLQLLGALGLLAGLWQPVVGGIAAAGLSLQMACGLAVRIRIRDSLLQCLPAAAYMLLCGWLAAELLF
jgi:hypothetical protein